MSTKLKNSSLNLSASTTIAATDGVTMADLGGEAVLLDVNSGQYFGLNMVGVKVFEYLSTPRSVDEVISHVADEFEVEEQTVEEDIFTFVRELLEAELAVIIGTS